MILFINNYNLLNFVMKKIFLVAVLAIASVSFMNAQENGGVKGTYNEVKSQIQGGGPRAICGNLGGWVGFSYQHGLSNGNMIDLAASVMPFNELSIGVQACYDWVNPFNTQIPWDKKGEWNWAMGVGLGGGIFLPEGGIGGHVGVAGHIGVAYDFWFPLELSIDWRPEIGVSLTTANSVTNAGFYVPGLLGLTLGVRYLF